MTPSYTDDGETSEIRVRGRILIFSEIALRIGKASFTAQYNRQKTWLQNGLRAVIYIFILDELAIEIAAIARRSSIRLTPQSGGSQCDRRLSNPARMSSGFN
jgi:hypothetical protein